MHVAASKGVLAVIETIKDMGSSVSQINNVSIYVFEY